MLLSLLRGDSSRTSKNSDAGRTKSADHFPSRDSALFPHDSLFLTRSLQIQYRRWGATRTLLKVLHIERNQTQRATRSGHTRISMLDHIRDQTLKWKGGDELGLIDRAFLAPL